MSTFGILHLVAAHHRDASSTSPAEMAGIWKETMQKVTAFNIPMASTTAIDYTAFTELPKQVKSVFYWWIPDPTFLGLDPLELMFPPYDRQAWLAGDKRTASTTTSIDIAVSGDLQALAPNAKNFLENWDISIKEVDKMLLDQIETGDDSATVACRWVQNHTTIWTDWLPDTTKCFAQFGLYNTLTDQFVTDRADKSFLECRACSSGTYLGETIEYNQHSGLFCI